MGPNPRKEVPMKSIWLELIQSLATLEISGQLVSKLHWIVNTQKKKSIGYNPETNRIDAVSSFELRAVKSRN